MVNNFNYSKTPDIYFGAGTINKLPNLAKSFGYKILIIKGKSSLEKSEFYPSIIKEIVKLGLTFYEVNISNEPSAAFVDIIVEEYRMKKPDVVISIGGGSVIDFGKAVSAMLREEGSVYQFLEGMETRVHNGLKIPFIAIPTSSGTGAEATKNAVLSEVGTNGFKRSLRHDNFVPNIAIIDPTLTLSCPQAITAACGLDALTQLIEAYVSTKASPYTDALAISGIEQFSLGFRASYEAGSTNLVPRTCMSYASLTSGIVLANAGLGAVHGIAGAIGGLFNIPHGVVCGSLLGEITKTNIESLLLERDHYKATIIKYSKISNLLINGSSSNLENACMQLIDYLGNLIEFTHIPKLSEFGITSKDVDKIISLSSNKNNPIGLSDDQLKKILLSRL